MLLISSALSHGSAASKTNRHSLLTNSYTLNQTKNLQPTKLQHSQQSSSTANKAPAQPAKLQHRFHRYSEGLIGAGVKQNAKQSHTRCQDGAAAQNLKHAILSVQ